MLICWLFGHRYEYELKRGRDEISLICVKCGKWRTLIEVQLAEPKTVLDVLGSGPIPASLATEKEI